MDTRCPLCGAALGKRKLAAAIVARMDMDCMHCKGRIRLNLHPLELRIVLLATAAFVAAALLAYLMQSEALVLLAFGIAAAGAIALELHARLRLREWPRYARAEPPAGTLPPAQ